LLLVDAVQWAAAYPVSAPLRDVYSWFWRWIKQVPQLTLDRMSADLATAPGSGTSGVIISGSPRDAWSEDPVNHRLMELVLACRQAGTPVLGVCYGHQIVARALGGKVARHPQGLELGNTPVRLTEAGRRSPIFQGFPHEFDVLSSHSDEVVEMPPGGELTVEGRFTANQGFQWGDRIFGVQFHPETDPEVLRFIWSLRLEQWQPKVPFNLAQRLGEFRPTPQAAAVLPNFVQYCLSRTF
jgi:GMP synthase (glutamine-hydrolysing)